MASTFKVASRSRKPAGVSGIFSLSQVIAKREGGRELASPFMEAWLKSHTTLPFTSHWLDLSTGSHLLPRRLGHKGAVDLSLRLRGAWVLGRQVASVPMAPSNKG